MPCPCYALTMPFFSRPRHSTAVERRPVGYLAAFGFSRLPHGVPRRLLSEAYQSSSQRSITMTVNSGSSTLQKRRSVKLLDYSSDISGYHGDFHEGHGTVGAWQGRGMLCVNRPLGSIASSLRYTSLTATQQEQTQTQSGYRATKANENTRVLRTECRTMICGSNTSQQHQQFLTQLQRNFEQVKL